ncbi:DUF6538 domain-containing protein [Yoonia sp.]|uniref:DUF6538 domain-containing protein n=1 Tax=Yoonia sp. TaxID=2212373 RepID=UPI00391AB804
MRCKTWYLAQRVPKRYVAVETRKRIISLSLETDSYSLACRKANDVWRAQIEHWEAKLDGRSEDARLAYEAARKVAQSRGFSYLPLERVVT